MAYTPEASNTAEPTIGREVRTAAEEFRVLKLDKAIKDAQLAAALADIFDLESRTSTLETQITAVGLGTDSVAYAANIASADAGKGASLVGSNDAGGWFAAVGIKTVEAFLQFIGAWMTRRDLNVFSYMSAAQIASVIAYNYVEDVTTPIQTAIDAGWAQRRDVFCPSGGYRIDAASLVLPGTRPTPETRDRSFRLYGQGYGNPFSNLNQGGTVFKSTANRPILTDNNPPTLPDYAGVVVTIPPSPDAQGTFTVDHIRFDGTSTTPVVLLNTASGISEYHHFVIYQRGDGDGLYVGYGATAHFHDFYVYNIDYVVTGTSRTGAARVGVGVNFPNSYGAGLVSFKKCTARGWRDAYIIGRSVAYPEAIAATKDVTAFRTTLEDFEVSTCYNGVTLQAKTSNCSVDKGYFEGMEDGVCITDNGVFNSITRNQIFAGFSKGIVLGAGSGYGGVCAWNEIATATKENVTLIEANMNLGLGRSVVDNVLVFGSSGTGKVGVVGIHILGLNPQLNLSGNMFNPKIAWSGGAGTVEILDASTSSLSAGSGLYGFGTAKISVGLQIPVMNQGALGIARDGTPITAAPAGVVTLSAASSFTMTFAAPTNVGSFTAPVLEGKLFSVRVTNANATFVNGANVKMAGSINYNPPAAGALIWFEVHSNVAEEVSRTQF